MPIPSWAVIEVKIRELGGDRRHWGPYQNLNFVLPELSGSWQAILKCEGGYGGNHETGMTSITHWRGELQDAHWGLYEAAEAHYQKLTDQGLPGGG